MPEPTARDSIQHLLDRHRPDRYDPSDKTWQDPVIDMIAAEIGDAEARQIAAVREVGNAEATATRRTNAMLRQIAESGQWPVGWLDAMAWPLATDDHERVALRAATGDDLEAFANRERRAAANDFASRNQACEGALILADRLAEAAVEKVSELGAVTL